MPSDHTLILLRGPSGSGKSSVARAVRAAWPRPMALVEQDYLRRILLKEKDVPNGVNAALIKDVVFFAFDHGYDVILEGIFDAERYQHMFNTLFDLHPNNNHGFYFDISFEETLRRHQSKPNKDDFGETEMRRWWKERDVLSQIPEILIPETNSFEETVQLILQCSSDTT